MECFFLGKVIATQLVKKFSVAAVRHYLNQINQVSIIKALLLFKTYFNNEPTS